MGDEWIYEIKYDGYRAQAHLRRGEPIIYSRRGYDWSDTFGNITQSLSALPSREVILDGEVVALNEKGISDFHRLQSELARKRSDRLVYLVFDILYLNGFDLRSAKLVDRKAVLAELLKGSADGPVRLSTHLEADGAVMFDRACAMQLEGIICKDRSSLYRSGRQDSWIKVKCAKTDTFPIVAFVEKLGARPRRIASLYLGRWEGDRLLYAGKAQSGFKQAMLYELRERLDRHIRQSSPLSVPVKKPKATWVDPVLPAEIEYSSLTSERLLRAPVFKGIREELVEIPSQQTQRQAIESARVRVPKENILQLLPDAVVPSKEELARYWHTVAPEALKYIARRPLKLVRHLHETTFYHKGPLPPLPPSVHALQIAKREGGTGIRVWVDDFEGLLGLVAIGAVELHAWNSTVEDLEHPDVMVFDLDPGPGVSFEFVRESAFALRDLLDQRRLASWPKLTGGKGVHLMVPLQKRSMSHDEAHRYSHEVAISFAATNPGRYTTSAATGERAGRVFVDYLRNGRGTTAVATYSPRARRGYPIAAPVSWRALEGRVMPDAFSMAHPFKTASTRKAPARGRKKKVRRRPSAKAG